MEIKRNQYLQQLIDGKGNHLIKIITGLRRCGKSYLLFNLFPAYLQQNGVPSDHIIKIDLEDIRNTELRSPPGIGQIYRQTDDRRENALHPFR